MTNDSCKRGRGWVVLPQEHSSERRQNTAILPHTGSVSLRLVSLRPALLDRAMEIGREKRKREVVPSG